MSKGTSLSNIAAIWPLEDVGKAEHNVFSCIGDLLAHHGRHSPASPAVLAPGGAALTYGAFWTGMNEIVGQLRSFGIDRGDRVAVVLPIGAEAAVATVAVAAGAVCVPLRGPESCPANDPPGVSKASHGRHGTGFAVHVVWR